MLLISSRDPAISAVFKIGIHIYSEEAVVKLRETATWEEDMGVLESLVVFRTNLRAPEV